MPGYGGQLVALNTETPSFDVSAPLMAASNFQKSQLQNQGLDTQNQAAQSELAAFNQNAPLQTQLLQQKADQQKRDSVLAQIGFKHALLSNAATEGGTSAESWDKAMKAAVENGVPEAGQFVGRYSPLLAKRIAQGYAAPPEGPEAVPSAPGPDGKGDPAANYDRAFEGKSLAELQQIHATLGPTRAAAMEVLNSSDPVAVWNAKAAQMGHPEMANASSPAQVIQDAQQLLDHIDPVDNYIRGRIEREGAGVPAPVVPRETKVAGDVLYSIDPSGKSAAAITPRTQVIHNADGSTSLVEVGASEPPTRGAGGIPAPKGENYDHIADLAAKDGAKPSEADYLKKLAYVESRGRSGEQNGSSTGLMQFHPDTFSHLGGTDITDDGQQIQAALKLQRQDRGRLKGAGIEPTDANTYIMHQQGSGGALALMRAPPDVNAVAALTPIYGSAKLARSAIVGNGGNADMTAGQFLGMWRAKWDGGGATAGDSGVPGVKVLASGQHAVDSSDALDPETTDYLAQMYVMDGKMPPMGMGKIATANRMAVLKAAAQMEADTGSTGADAVTRHLAVKSAGMALTKATQMRSATESFENTALRNGDLAMSLAAKGGGQTGAPVLNRWLQAGRSAIAGDPDVTAFNVALGTFSDEYAKIMSGSMGSSPVTDASRKEAYDRLSKYATQGQLQSGYGVMKQEMANRIASMKENEANLTTTVRNGGKAPSAASVAGVASPAAAQQTPQLKAAMKFLGSTARDGSVGNPYTPKTQDAWKRLPAGAYYIDIQGNLVQKRAQ